MSAPAPTPALLRRWTEEVAADPRSIAFFPLAQAYADRGHRDAAIRLCLQGLGHHPEHVDAHVLLGRLYRSAGDAEKAFDEWDIALRLAPGHAAARREIEALRSEGSPASRSPSAGDAAAAPRGLSAPLDRFVATVQPTALLLLSSSGRLLGRHGATQELDCAGIASLAAGIHAAAAALAALMGEPRFGHLVQRGTRSALFLGGFGAPGGELILVVLLRDQTRLGLLRLGFAALADEIAALDAAALPKRSLAAETFERDLESGLAEILGAR
jgi:tetratricopeptide (TPR) repeat protein